MLAYRPMRAASTSPWSARGTRVELAIAIGLAWTLVVARSFVFAAFPHAAFDSDQAIVGLMAKHLSEGRAFPLYLYGYSYMLAVESWIAVPYFWIAGPTVAALKASIIGTNLAIVALLIVGLSRWGGLRPLAAVVPVVFFAFVPPDTAAKLVDAGGGTIEQFLWVLILWFVRDRPFTFGAVLAVGFLNREFTVYAVPVIILGQIWSRVFFRRETWRAWLFSLIAFLAVWQGIQALKPLADLMGPGTRGASSYGQTASPTGNMSQRMRIDVAATPGSIVTLLRGEVANLLGGRPSTDAVAVQGRSWIGWLLFAAAAAAVGRVAWLSRCGDRPIAVAATGWYALGVGMMSVVGYALTRPTDVVTPRYLLLSVFIPVGLTAVWLALEPRRVVRGAIVVVVALWASVAGIDSWRQYDRYASGREPDGMQQLIDALDARSIGLAEAEHWRAYKLTFLARERIKVASTDIVRIWEYRRLADEAGASLVRLQYTPCPGGEFVGGMYICVPPVPMP